MLHGNLTVNGQKLYFNGADTTALAKKYGTPLMLLDEDLIRARMRMYKDAMEKYFGVGSQPLFASKALCFKGIYRIAEEENIGIDIVSPGELYTAQKAGYDVSKGFFHGNSKSDEDIEYGVDSDVGYFVADNVDELNKIESYCASKGKVQKVLLRLTPGIDPHTHKAINTGKVDSKFGTPIETGQADEIVRYTLGLKHVRLEGFHCHIGSQIFDIKPFCDAADIMIKYVGHVKDEFGYIINIVNLGGGFGVRYVESDPNIDYVRNIKEISEHIKKYCDLLKIAMPRIVMEPGRSIVADAGLTLYSVDSIKEVRGYKSYVAIDGGMTDNPRYALYQSSYTVALANRMDEKCDYRCTIAGKCCESGDLIQEDVLIPKPVRNDLVAVFVTGAYNYAMASNYNRVARPPIVLIKDGKDALAVKRETYGDLVKNDI